MKHLIQTSFIAVLAMPFAANAAQTLIGVAGVISALLNFLVPVFIVLALLYFIYGVIKYIVADSDEAKSSARNVMIYGVIGLFVIVSVWGLVAILQATFGTTETTLPLPTVGGGGGF
ncbi:MAG: hypothetical protein COW88_02820 [Candidatus Lloydbacteria bacterium CG22_combo_CG10-13_8_21_14_all_47_15]|uniref:Uncharacterized protein n=1 Tax=Candidatus Lloydbacteria bacterium CG22_combo_CG10-13_8_21_14_all_47_15 TaxID=1974635 RepID=A0A2H0CTY0_9BACT|nr:MAG: hypothetical protein COW88_02820 [Candidatus Lloydbacteria bacterium CG22_combo_CG10-13_8_21_14_all_47_15]